MKWWTNFLNAFKKAFSKKPVKKEVELEKDSVEKKPEITEEEKKKETIKVAADDIINAKKKQNKKLFDDTLPLILKYEGGYVNDPDDPGGETNKGIIKENYDKYRKSKDLQIRSVKEITDEEINDIYYNEYWLKGLCDKVFDDLAIIHFDACVNSGIKQASKFLQRSCGAEDDGTIGPNTLKAVAATDKKLIIEKYFVHRNNFYEDLAHRKPELQKFLKGWLKRVAHLEEYINDKNVDENPTVIV